jgi:hypothetical protein
MDTTSATNETPPCLTARCCDFTPFEGRKWILTHIRDMPPQQKLDTYHQFYSSLPKQGTREWEENRLIGASQVASILGCNKYKSCREETECILKIRDGSRDRNLFTTWGNIFEPAAKVLLSRWIRIYEFSSLPGFGNPTVTSCSPDGVFLYNSDLDEEVYGPHPEHGQPCMLEIKCPFRRAIGDIPEYYFPQMYMGMSTIQFVNHTLFCEFAIRVCSLWDFNFTTAQKTIPPQQGIKNVPEALGFVAVYLPKTTTWSPNPPIPVDEVVFQKTEDSIWELGRLWRTIDEMGVYSQIEKMVMSLRYFPSDLVSEFFHRKVVYLREIFSKEEVFPQGEIFSKEEVFPQGETSPQSDLPQVADLGATKGWLECWTDDYNVLLQATEFWYSDVLTTGGTDWDCKCWVQKELARVPHTIGENRLVGILPYKLMERKYEMVPKIDYISQIKQVVGHGRKIQEIRSKPREDWDQFLNTL